MTGEHGHILVVDDNRMNRLKLSHSLEQQGHTVALAADGQQAVALIQDQAFDLLLLDIVMPEMDGFQVLAYMKRDRRLRDIPVIVISALDEMESVVRCIEMGAEDYLPKSFDPVLLRARIQASLEKKRLRDQEIAYLQHVEHLTAAAVAVEAGTFESTSLSEVATRSDALGQLARVFRRMAQEVDAREQRLKQEVQALRIEIDTTRKQRHVAEITESDYFRQLQDTAQDLRDLLRDGDT